jgi:hypothetical protein
MAAVGEGRALMYRLVVVVLIYGEEAVGDARGSAVVAEEGERPVEEPAERERLRGSETTCRRDGITRRCGNVLWKARRRLLSRDSGTEGTGRP